ncbi:EAL domain-containing protein [Roseateles sp. DAIF2]|uniref:putative bifunctional diguanylate cyclase/phosphodiesterase n=1 Tax=Roseateles sp. DAIF2 TaxID=2714952 RepID=UPI0018A2A840|nr:EAL domain-containing protein [Roseateles sp. DAIF2]QPF74423.1 EAL domain-containing protein [Roseateles sp. DAIF2]
MLQRAQSPNPHVPAAYLGKWRAWLQQLCEAFDAEMVIVSRLQEERLVPVLESGCTTLEQLPFLREAAGHLGRQAIAMRALVQLDESDGHGVGVPLCWPDRAVFGSLALFVHRARLRRPGQLRLVEMARQLFEADFRTLHFVRAIDEHKNLLETRIGERTQALSELNLRLEHELRLSQRTAQVLKQLVIGVPGSGGQSYFRQLVCELARLLGAEHAFVALLDPQQPQRARTIACYSGEAWRDKFEYEPEQTPCAQVLQRMAVFGARALAQDFPATAAQTGLPAESYLGAPLLDETGRAVGVLAALGGPALLEAHLAHEIMELLAARTGTEIRRMRAEDELRHMALQDELTGLPNRNNFKDRLSQAIAQAQRNGTRLALLFIDLDNFKTINDSLGHDVGDAVLVQIAQTLQACMRDMDTIARLGGDEFAALLPGVDSLQIDAVCRRIMQALRLPLVCQGYELFVSASIGCCLYPEDGLDQGNLTRAADAAMYRAKALGKNQLQFYALDIKQAIQRDLAVGNQLRKAIRDRRLHLAYQPKVRLDDGSLAGAEALCRWTDEELGRVSPAEFIPIAERSGVVADLGAQVIELAVADMVAWRAQGLAVPVVAVNVSAKQLQMAGFAAWLDELLRRQALPADRLLLELTEGVLMERNDANQQMLADLVERGFRISVDDFGTGYSSLAYLKRMPISEIKIDRSFVSHIAEDQGDQAIAAAILTLAHTLKLRVVAEGVEDRSQLHALRALDCDMAQGYFFHRPLEPAAFRALLARHCAQREPRKTQDGRAVHLLI